jgi:hypothetical protein
MLFDGRQVRHLVEEWMALYMVGLKGNRLERDTLRGRLQGWVSMVCIESSLELHLCVLIQKPVVTEAANGGGDIERGTDLSVASFS